MSNLADISRYIWPDVSQGRQPQHAAPIDKSWGLNPEFVFNPGAGIFDLATGSKFTVGAGASIGAGPVGVAVTSAGVVSPVLSRTGGKTAAKTRVTFIAVIRRTSSVTYQGVMATTGGSGGGFGFVFNNSGTGLNITKYSIVQGATLTIPSDIWYVVIGSTDQTSGSYYVAAKPLTNGAITFVSNQTSTSVSLAGNGSYYVGSCLPSDPNFSGSIALAVASFDFMPMDVAIRLLENPWQIFDTPATIYSAVAAAGGIDGNASWAGQASTAAAATFSATAGAAASFALATEVSSALAYVGTGGGNASFALLQNTASPITVGASASALASFALSSASASYATWAASAGGSGYASYALATVSSVDPTYFGSGSATAGFTIETANAIPATWTAGAYTGLLNAADITAIANAVWAHPSSLSVAVQLAETWGRLGLDPSKPLVQGQTQISFGSIVMALSETSTTVTVTRA